MIYLDHNATTPLDRRVRRGMVELLEGSFLGNPSSTHLPGQRARAILEDARRAVAHSLGADPLEVVFVGGGTESDNLAVLGAVNHLRSAEKPHSVLSSPIEHPAVLSALAHLKADGVPVYFVQPDAEGRIDARQISDFLQDRPGEVGFMSFSAANHELGNVYDVASFAETARFFEPSVVIHCDAVQAFGKVDVDFGCLGVDMLSVSSHKIGGPTGAGALLLRRGVELDARALGGGQERGFRPGTENLVALHGFGQAAGLVVTERQTRRRACAESRDLLLAAIEQVNGARVHGCREAHSDTTVLASFSGCEGELLLIGLDLEGIAVSTGSACSSGRSKGSAVLAALGFGNAVAQGALRISVGTNTSPQEIDRFRAVFPGVVDRVRRRGTRG